MYLVIEKERKEMERRHEEELSAAKEEARKEEAKQKNELILKAIEVEIESRKELPIIYKDAYKEIYNKVKIHH